MSQQAHVKWSQQDTSLLLVVEVTEPKKDTVKVDLANDSIKFEVEDNGGLKVFQLKFHKRINPEKYSVKVKDRRINLTITKSEDSEGEWGRLSPDKHRWLKFDIDSVEVTDEETKAARKLADAKKRLEAEHGPLPEDAKIQQVSNMINADDISRDLEAAEKEMWDLFRNSYLTIYNSVVWLGYFYILFMSVLRVAIEGQGAIGTNYEAMGWLLRSCQQTVFLELIHSITGLTKTPFPTVLMQVAGRAVVLFAVVDGEVELQRSLACYILVLAWSAIEVVRYPYYIAQTYQLYIPKLMWARYTAWIPLYPVGLACEVLLVYWSMLAARDSGRLTLSMPNSLNVGFHFPTFLAVDLPARVLGGLVLMRHMSSQRRGAMRKLNRLRQVQDVQEKERELHRVQQQRASKKHA